MKICYLPIESLRPNPNNFLTPLSDEEYAQLRESIIKFGVLEPLIVVPEASGIHAIIAGNHRYKIALDIGLKELQCIIIEKTMIEGAFDTEIFRRHLTREQKEEFRLIKERVCKEIIDKLLRERLLPEFYEEYRKGGLEQRLAFFLIKFDKEDQVGLIQFREKAGKIDLEKVIEQKDALIEKLKNSKKELKETLEEYEEEIVRLRGLLEGAQKDVNEAMKKEFMKELEHREKIREELVKQLRKKDEEIERLKNQERVEEEKRQAEEIEKKSADILKLEKQKKYMVNIVLHCIDVALENIESARKKLIESEMPIKDANLAREKIKIMVEKLRELLSLIRIEKKEKEKEFHTLSA